MKTVKTARRTAIEHSFLAASIVAAGALFKDTAPDTRESLPMAEDAPIASAVSGESAREPWRVASADTAMPPKT